MTDVDHAYYYAVLDGQRMPVFEDKPELGVYRWRASKTQPWLPVHIYDAEQSDGRKVRVALLNGQGVDVTKVWPYCADKPVTGDAYTYHLQHKAWPGDYRPIHSKDEDDPLGNYTDNQPPATIDAKLTAELDAAAEWLRTVKTIKTEDQATKAANIVAVIRNLCKLADDAHGIEKAPILKRAKEIDDKYLRPIERGKTGVKTLLAQITKWRNAEAEKRAKEAAEQAIETNEEPPFEPVKIAAVGGQHGKKVHFQKVVTFEVVNHAEALAFFAENDEIKAAVATLATKFGKAGTVAPGVKRHERQEAT